MIILNTREYNGYNMDDQDTMLATGDETITGGSGTVSTGTVTTGGGATTLIDSAATFVTDGVAVDDVVIVPTDNTAIAKVTSVDSETQLTTEILSGGSSYNVGDGYSVENCDSFTESSPNARTGLILPNASITTSGKIGDAFNFDGNLQSIVTFGNLPAFELGSNDFTMDAWVYPTVSFFGAIIAKYRVSIGWLFRVNGTSVDFYTGTGGILLGSAGGTVPLNQWTHVAVVRKGNQWRLYVNGGIRDSLNSSHVVPTSNEQLWLGRQNYQSRVLTGRIDHARLSIGMVRWERPFEPPARVFY